MGPGPIYSRGQKQRVFEPYSLSLSFNVASSTPKYSCVLTDYFLIMENSALKTGGEKIDKEGSVYYFLGYEHLHHRRHSFINHFDLFFLSICSLQSSGERKKSILAQQYCFPFFNHHKYYFFPHWIPVKKLAVWHRLYFTNLGSYNSASFSLKKKINRNCGRTE